MKYLLLLLAVTGALGGAPEVCTPAKCLLQNGCKCSSLTGPMSPADMPQLVMVSFDDSAARLVFDELWRPVLYGRRNPDGCPIGVTFFVPHGYSDYEVVNMLYNNGFEIGSHSITKNPLLSYWRNLTKAEVVQEMGGQRTIISKFANIPTSEIRGARMPLFEINENTFTGLKESQFSYDNSWSSKSSKPFFPHTLDFLSDLQCFRVCQPETVPGLWELPIIDWVDMHGTDCNKLLGCHFEGKEDEILEWMKKEFGKVYRGNRAPFSLSVNYGVFGMVENSLGAFKRFLDYLATLRDVFVVNESVVQDWMKSPKKINEFHSCKDAKPPATCSPITCALKIGDEETRYMRSCVGCPKNYPWLGNPEGK